MHVMALHPILYLQLQLGLMKQQQAKPEIVNSSKQALRRHRLQIS
jgi:hypothetical protein